MTEKYFHVLYRMSDGKLEHFGPLRSEALSTLLMLHTESAVFENVKGVVPARETRDMTVFEAACACKHRDGWPEGLPAHLVPDASDVTGDR